MTTHIALAAGLAVAASAIAAPSFNAPSQLATAQRPGGVASADFNADGLADLAVAADTIDRIDLFFGTGGGAFAAPVSVFTGNGTGPDSLMAADVNGDGQPDLVVVLKNTNTVRVYQNNAGVFAPGASASTGVGPVSLDGADIDGDGDVDFITANRDDNSISIITNAGGALSSANITIGDEPRDAAPLDLDGDGQHEIAVSSHRERTIYVLASGTYTVQQSINLGAVVRPEGLMAADIDGDGDTDLAAVMSDDVASRAGAFFNTAGVLGPEVSAATNGANSSDVAAADFDLDGDMDLAVTNTDGNSISIMENTGGAFAPGVATGVGVRPERVTAADLDNNGSPDLAVTNRDSNDTWTFASQASGDPQPCNAADIAAPFAILDLADVQAFVSGFVAQDPIADIAPPLGTFDLADIQAFIGAFLAGCP
ncbi:MAG: VCBS repeat-containing protein [Phycisphaeraceae bacterium]|nr:MAG: VCBS repeat-containing protein [Phycisphaeraceae bacterium]